VLLGIGDELVFGLTTGLVPALAVDPVGHVGSSPLATPILSRWRPQRKRIHWPASQAEAR
jgi:hypothetical protein